METIPDTARRHRGYASWWNAASLRRSSVQLQVQRFSLKKTIYHSRVPILKTVWFPQGTLCFEFLCGSRSSLFSSVVMIMLVLVLFMTRYISSSVYPVASTYILVGSCLHYCAVNWLTESDHTPYKASCRESSPTSRRAARRRPANRFHHATIICQALSFYK